MEHEGDDIAHRAFERLHTQFITPSTAPRSTGCSSRIDDVLDLTDAAAERLLLYEIGLVPQDAKELARLLVLCREKMQEAVAALREHQEARSRSSTACKDIKTCESEADALRPRRHRQPSSRAAPTRSAS